MIEAVTFPDPARPNDDDSLKALTRKLSGSGYHPSCTVKMGPASDPMAVVDQRGCCHFQDGLVVADASILPFVPRANTNSVLDPGRRDGGRVAAHRARPLRPLSKGHGNLDLTRNPPMADISIRNVSVLDGTGSPAFAADVLVEGGRISAVDTRT